MTATTDDVDFLELIKQELNECLHLINKSQAAFISTVDGHLLVARNRAEFDIEALCPMSGSLIGIAEALTKQLDASALDDAIIRSEKGVLATIKLNDRSSSLLLGICASKMVNLGSLMTQGKQCAEKVRNIIENC